MEDHRIQAKRFKYAERVCCCGSNWIERENQESERESASEGKRRCVSCGVAKEELRREESSARQEKYSQRHGLFPLQESYLDLFFG